MYRGLQTLKHEVLDRFVIVSERSLNHVRSEGIRYYNTERGHASRDNLPPTWDAAPDEVTTIRPSDVVGTTRLGGLLKRGSRLAA